jgi:hypothetical protein
MPLLSERNRFCRIIGAAFACGLAIATSPRTLRPMHLAQPLRAAFCLLIAVLLAPFCASAASLAVGDPAPETGTRIDLPDDTQLQLLVEDQNLIGYFLDAAGRVIPTPATSILFVITQPGHREDDWRTVLEPVGSIQMTSPRKLFGPYQVRARVIIRFPEGEPLSFTRTQLDLEGKP